LADPLMGPSRVEVSQRVFGEDVLQVPLGEDDQVIEALAAHAAEKSLAHEFMSGARTAVRKTRAPAPLATRSNTGPNLSSRSRAKHVEREAAADARAQGRELGGTESHDLAAARWLDGTYAALDHLDSSDEWFDAAAGGRLVPTQGSQSGSKERSRRPLRNAEI
jgi:hypothetical protein